jgi:hypothetical protein
MMYARLSLLQPLLVIERGALVVIAKHEGHKCGAFFSSLNAKIVEELLD